MGNLRSNSEIKPRVIFVAWNFYFDYSNGASITAREILLGLASSGWEVSTLCGPCIDNPEVSDVFKILRSFKVSFREVFRMEKPSSFSVYSFQESGLFSSLFVPRDDSPIPNREVGRLFLDFVADSLQKMKPDIVITYGGFWMASELLRVVRQFGAKSVFLLQNFAYWERDVFSLCDLVVVPSYFARDVYKDRLGIETVVIPPLIQRDKVVFSDENRLDSQQYVLFVNPSLNKGVMLFARIAYEMHKRRPEIPFLIVEGCSTNDDILHRLPLLNGVKNIYKFPATTSPKNFYRFAKLTLVPSFFDENLSDVL